MPKNQSWQHLKNDTLFAISGLYIINNILHELSPEEAIRLACTNPAFKTPFSVMLQNQRFFAELTQDEIKFSIALHIINLSKLSEKERQEYILNIENEYQHDEFLKHFKHIIEEYNNINNFLIKTIEKQIQLLISTIDKAISMYSEIIKALNTKMAILNKEVHEIQREINALSYLANDLYLKILLQADIKNEYFINFSEQSRAILSHYGIKDLGINYDKDSIIEYLYDSSKKNPDEFELPTLSDYRDMAYQLIREDMNIKFSHLPADIRKIIIENELSTTSKVDEIATDIKSAIEKNKKYKELENVCELRDDKKEQKNKKITEIEICKKQIKDYQSDIDSLVEAKVQITSINPKLSMADILSKLAAQINLDAASGHDFQAKTGAQIEKTTAPSLRDMGAETVAEADSRQTTSISLEQTKQQSKEPAVKKESTEDEVVETSLLRPGR